MPYVTKHGSMQEHKEAWTAARKHLQDQIRARITMDVVGMRVASKRGADEGARDLDLGFICRIWWMA
jgi:hypothetical protein